MPSHLMLTLEMDDTRIGLVTGIETAPAKPRVVEQPTHMIHRHNVCEYHYLYKGSFCMACNDQQVTLQPGQVLVIGPDVFHHYDSYSEDLGTMVCQFTLEQIPGRKGLWLCPTVLPRMARVCGCVRERQCRHAWVCVCV